MKCAACGEIIHGDPRLHYCQARNLPASATPDDEQRKRSKRDRIERLRTRAIAGSSVDQLRNVVLGILDLLGDEL